MHKDKPLSLSSSSFPSGTFHRLMCFSSTEFYTDDNVEAGDGKDMHFNLAKSRENREKKSCRKKITLCLNMIIFPRKENGRLVFIIKYLHKVFLSKIC